MSIKSDKWIRRMAAEHGMIEPFEAGQVRELKGEKIVSYGTSSYGYDIRCSDEFKIFTNVHSTVVDPKHFDEKSFVNFKGPVCIIPPNSFALARTVEYFRIPRNVLTYGRRPRKEPRYARRGDGGRCGSALANRSKRRDRCLAHCSVAQVIADALKAQTDDLLTVVGRSTHKKL